MDAYEKTSIQINRCKRILELVDTYVDCPTQDHRTALRKALMDEFEPPAIAPPVAAGSVDMPTWTSEAISCAYLPGAKQFVELEIHQQFVADALAGQAQDISILCEKNDILRTFANAVEVERETWQGRAEKAEAELAQVNEWRAAALASNQQLQELMTAKLAAAEARVSELEEENADLQLEMQDERQRHFD